MNLPVLAVKEFMDIYQRKVGGGLTFDEANLRAENFLRLMLLITKKPKIKVNDLVLNKNEK